MNPANPPKKAPTMANSGSVCSQPSISQPSAPQARMAKAT